MIIGNVYFKKGRLTRRISFIAQAIAAALLAAANVIPWQKRCEQGLANDWGDTIAHAMRVRSYNSGGHCKYNVGAVLQTATAFEIACAVRVPPSTLQRRFWCCCKVVRALPRKENAD